jgi:hypothetical protein
MHAQFLFLFIFIFYLYLYLYFFYFFLDWVQLSPCELNLTQLTRSRPVTRLDGMRTLRMPAQWIIIRCYCSSELKCKRSGAYLNAGTEMITEAWWSAVLLSSALLCLWFSFSFTFCCFFFVFLCLNSFRLLASSVHVRLSLALACSVRSVLFLPPLFSLFCCSVQSSPFRMKTVVVKARGAAGWMDQNFALVLFLLPFRFCSASSLSVFPPLARLPLPGFL